MSSARSTASVELTERQRRVLEAVATGYLCEPSPIASATVAALLPTRISPASIRATMAELTELGLLEKRHASAGRIPSERGLRLFVEALLQPGELSAWDRRMLARALDELPGEAPSRALRHASEILTHHTGLLGFVLSPGIASVEVRHLTLVRVSRERLLAVLVARSGQAHQRVIEDPGTGDQAELDRIAWQFNERFAGLTLSEIRRRLSRDVEAVRSEADRLVRRALELGLRICDGSEDDVDLVIATRLALLDQPEFHDPAIIRELFEALEEREQLLEVLDRVIEAEEVSVTFGGDLQKTGLHRCALVAAPFGAGADDPAQGALGVIGPSRMDYARVIPLVSYCSRLLTEKLQP